MRELRPREKPPLSGEVAERSDGRRGFSPFPLPEPLPNKTANKKEPPHAHRHRYHPGL